MLNTQAERLVKIAPVPGAVNHRKIVVAGVLWGMAEQHNGGVWFIESADQSYCGHVRDLRQLRHAVFVNIKEHLQ
jgi:hypothetical protein